MFVRTMAFLVAGGFSVMVSARPTGNVPTVPATAETGSSFSESTQAPAPPAAAESPAAAPSPSSPTTQKSSATGTPAHRVPTLPSKGAETYYGTIWGVDSLRVKYTESGEVVRFSYRVLDAEKAKTLNDHKNEPSLIDPKAGVKLVVPSLEKVGKLRQSSPAETGKTYWMAFSNKGRLVKPGDHVNVVIGNFQANGLIVE
jgi:hypothetical protein